RRAFGAPGIAPRWTESAKDAIGTAYSAGSTVWFTVSAGILNEVYYPTIDRPQIRDLQYLVTDGEHFFHDERRHLESRVEPLEEHALGVRLINTERAGRYRIVKEVIADPHQPCILIRTWLEGDERVLAKLRLFALLAPHLDVGGWENSGYVAETAGRAFGNSLHHAATTLLQSLGFPFAEHRERFIEQWERTSRHLVPLADASGDGGRLYRASHRVLLAHEDKRYPGAMIASLSIPWGETKGDDDLGGYHLGWTRDMVNSTTGLLAAGNTETPLRALIYLACSQRPDGGFHQNFWVDGEPYWRGIQLDEVAFPILLAWQLQEARALRDFDPYPMVLRAAGYLMREGPVTPQERWEENSGYSPSTLASNIAALTCAARLARERGEAVTAAFVERHADFLAGHVEAWTVTTDGSLVPGIRRHFIRIRPVDPNDPEPDEDPDRGVLTIRNRPPGERTEFPAKEVVDAGFLELVRYGILKPGQTIVEDSLRVVDATLKVETPFGPCWRRYNHDGYGQRDDGGPFDGWGRGRAWPLLTGERGHHELAAGRDVGPYLRAMEGFATAAGLLPEQVWDAPDRPAVRMRLGRPTGSAMPLMWAHAEYVKLLRSAHEGRVFDRIPAVVERYQGAGRPQPIEVWSFKRRARAVRPEAILRIQAGGAFRLRWTADEWAVVTDTPSTSTALGIDVVD